MRHAAPFLVAESPQDHNRLPACCGFLATALADATEPTSND